MDRLKKKLLLPDSITAGRWALLRDHDDVEDVAFKSSLGTAEFHALLDDAAGVGLSTTPMTEADITVAPQLQAVARIGVGYYGADVPALTKRRALDSFDATFQTPGPRPQLDTWTAALNLAMKQQNT